MPPDQVAVAKTDTVVEYVLYRGAFNDEDKFPLYSDQEMMLVQMHRLDEVRNAQAEGRSRPVLCVSKRICTYPLNADGSRRALGSTCDETEVVS